MMRARSARGASSAVPRADEVTLAECRWPAGHRLLHLVEVFEPRGSVQEWTDGGEELSTRLAADEALLGGEVVPLQDVGDRRRCFARAIQPAWMAAGRLVHWHNGSLEDADKGLHPPGLDGYGGNF